MGLDADRDRDVQTPPPPSYVLESCLPALLRQLYYLPARHFVFFWLDHQFFFVDEEYNAFTEEKDLDCQNGCEL